MRLVSLSVMLLLVVSCGQGNSPVEKQEKQAGVEQAQREDSEDPRDALTEQEIARMSNKEAIALLECQAQKVVADLGQQEATDYVRDLVIPELTKEGTDITSAQVLLLRE